MRPAEIVACLAAILSMTDVSGTASGAEPTFPVTSGFGFDWHDPESAQCVRIDSAMIRNFKHCAFHDSGAFGLPLAYHACASAEGSEFLVFESQAACEEALETMQANAP